MIGLVACYESCEWPSRKAGGAGLFSRSDLPRRARDCEAVLVVAACRPYKSGVSFNGLLFPDSLTLIPCFLFSGWFLFFLRFGTFLAYKVVYHKEAAIKVGPRFRS
jgi:hypothetical protein